MLDFSSPGGSPSLKRFPQLGLMLLRDAVVLPEARPQHLSISGAVDQPGVELGPQLGHRHPKRVGVQSVPHRRRVAPGVQRAEAVHGVGAVMGERLAG